VSATVPVPGDRPHRYQQIARFVTDLVQRGALAPGARAPSLREVSRVHKVSLSTATQAYRLLEDRGVLLSRPQSGFFVARGASIVVAEPKPSQPTQRARNVSIPRIPLALLEHAADPQFAPLGCAIPAATLLASGRLNRHLARLARTQGVARNVYTPPNGLPELRQQIARRALQWGQALSPDHIVVTCGCTEALNLALDATVAPGETVATDSPAYFGLIQILKARRLRILELPTDPVTGIDLDALRTALRRKLLRACVLPSSFSNPLGYTLTDPKKRAILKLLAAHHIPLIEDDIYGDLYFGTERPAPFMALNEAPGAEVIYCSSFSKTLAPGYRIGWVIAGDERIEGLLTRKFTQSLCSAPLPQLAMSEFLASEGYDNHLRRLRAVFSHTIVQMRRIISERFPPGTRVTNPAGGFVLWVELPARLDSSRLLALALEQRICFVPGEICSATGRFRNHLRLSCGSPWQEISQAVMTLGAIASDAAARL
jgi:DNA-binding transcriptional MocR family regulator